MSTLSIPPKRPNTNDLDAWHSYWNAQGYPWRTEPEIDEERQLYLSERYNIKPDTKQKMYPFKDIKLTRADIEWLLTMQAKILETAYRTEGNQLKHLEMDLRKADLRSLDLRGLPEPLIALILYKIYQKANTVGVSFDEVSMEMGGPSSEAITKATFFTRFLEEANLAKVHLEGIHLNTALLKHVNLEGAYLQGTDFSEADLRDANLKGAYLQGANLSNTDLQGANLKGAYLQGANFSGAHMELLDLSRAHLEGADFSRAYLQGTNLNETHLEGANLSGAILGEMYVRTEDYSNLWRTTDLRLAFFSNATRLDHIILGRPDGWSALLADINWGDVNLAVVDWALVKVLGDQREVGQSEINEQKEMSQRRIIEKDAQLNRYQAAVRAYRQLSIVLKAQGMDEHAARFAYRAQVVQRVVLRRQRHFGQYLFSLFLDLLAGYGFKPLRSFITYAFVIGGFAFIYHLLGTIYSPILTWKEAIVVSMTAFHGRGFFPDQFKPSDPQAMVAAFEAFVGLIIEVTFIATLTQRLFRK